MLAMPGYALAYTTDLVICLDASSSMSAAEWSIQKSGTTLGLTSALSPDYLDSSVRVSVVQFPTSSGSGGSVGVVVPPTVIDSAVTLDDFNASVNALTAGGGFRYTNIQRCIDVARTTMGCGTVNNPAQCPDDGVRRIIDISTDGDPTTSTNCPYVSGSDRHQRCAVWASGRAKTAGVDVINVIAVGNVSTTNAQAWAYPTPVSVFNTSGPGCSLNPPAVGCFPEVGEEGFVVKVNDFHNYVPAIDAKLKSELHSGSFTVRKTYSDNNTTAVEVTLSCTGGDGSITSPNPAMAAPGSPAVFTYGGYTTPPTCTAIETNGPSGYITDNSDCQSAQALGGSCTITNTLDQARINVIKNTIGGDGSFLIQANGPVANSYPLNLTTVSGTASTFADVAPTGAFTVAETPVVNWDLVAASCVNDNGGAAVGSWDQVNTITGINLSPGDSITCTFTNALRGSVNLVKNSVGGNGSFDFVTNLPGTNGALSISTANGTGSIGVTGIPAGTYSIAETVPSGWSLDSASCSNGSSANALSIAEGESVTCTFTNTRLGSIIVEKQTLPDGSAQTFAFSGDAAGNIGDGGQIVVSNLTPGTYTATEALVAGWNLTSIVCNDGASVNPSGGDPATATATFRVDAGETIKCVFTNTQEGSIEVVKTLSATGPAVELFGFSSTFNGAFNLQGNGATTGPIAVAPGNNYRVSEDDPTAIGWANVSASCTGGDDPTTSIQVSPGEAVVCTFTNTPLGSATIVKKTIGGDGTFDFTGDAPFDGLQLTTVGGTASQDFTYQLDADTYRITEAPVPDGWSLTGLGCVEDGNQDSTASIQDATATMGVELNETVTCTFTNTADGTLIIRKQTLPDTASQAFTFSGDAAGSIHAYSNTAEELSVTGQPGVYRSAEVVPAGWDLTAISCTGQVNSVIQIGAGAATFEPGDSDIQVSLAAGETVICTYENTALGSITIDKVSVGGTGIFNFNAGDLGGFQLDTSNVNPDSKSFTDLLPGEYLISEIIPANWKLSDISCSGATNSTVTIGGAGGYDAGDQGVTINLADGEDISCTFTNTRLASLALVKTVTNDNGGTAAASDWTLSAAGDSSLSGAGGVSATFVNPGAYTLSEAGGPDGYTAGNWSCTDGTLIGSTVTLAAGDVAVCSINNDDDAANLALVKQVVNDNGGDAIASDWTLSAAGPTPLTGAGGVASSPVNAGVYTLSESNGPDGYTAGVWSCSGGSLSGSSLTLASGESATCTIINDDNAPGLTLIKTVTNDNGGTAVASDWTLSATGPTSISGVSGSQAVTGADVDAGNYTLSESGGPDGYTAGGWSCSGGTLQGSILTLGVGESAVCSINNDDDPASLGLVKTVTNDDQGAAVASDWTLEAAGPTPLSGEGGVAATLVDAGIYTLSESGGPVGYTAGDWSCTAGSLQGNSLTLGSGESAVCTINNDDDPAAVNLAKTVNGPATLETDGTYTVEYTITATNSGGPGVYSLVDTVSPGAGITLNTATAVYVAGTENNQSGTLGVYPNFVADESLAPGLHESWTVTANFAVNAAQVDALSSQCDAGNPLINTGFYNAVSGSSTDPDTADNDACTGLQPGTLTLVKIVTGDGDAAAGDFALTLTGADGTHDAGVGYHDGDTPAVKLGVEYEVTEAAAQVAGYYLESIACTDDADQSALTQPFRVNPGQAVTCTVVNTPDEVVFDVLAEACRSDASYVDYDVTTSSGTAQEVTITWIKNDGSEEVVETLQNQPVAGSLLWPGTHIVGGVAVAWPGWSCDAQGANCTPVSDGLLPTMKLKFAINPEATMVVAYPPVTADCVAGPRPPVPETPAIPVPVDNKFALLMLVLMVLASGWYLRPIARRKHW